MNKRAFGRTKRKSNEPFFSIKLVVTIIFAIYAFTLILPIAWGFIVSLTSKRDFILYGFTRFPTSLHFENYILAFKELTTADYSFATMITNSVWYSAGSALLSVAVSTITAYAVARYEFRGKHVIYWTAVISMMIPIVSNLPSLFKLTSKMGIYDSPFILISQMSGIGFNFVIMYAFFKNISKEYSEAAFIDGASDFRVFLRIILPMGISPMIALWLTQFNGYWSDANFPILFLPSFPTLASGLHVYSIDVSRVPGGLPILFAGLLMSAVPIVILFIIFQNRLMDLQFSGGTKG